MSSVKALHLNYQFFLSEASTHIAGMGRADGHSDRRMIMPLIRVSLRAGKPADYRRAIAENIYESLRETFDVPESDFFATVDELESRDFIYDRKYFNIERSDDLVVIQLTVSNTRTVEQKKALYRRIVERLGKSPGLRPQDIFLNLLEVAKENWSFGNGEAQYA
jgi:phenylpyruvate tautomerase PptA (4-oxalocrotonate tautomerase family)